MDIASLCTGLSGAPDLGPPQTRSGGCWPVADLAAQGWPRTRPQEQWEATRLEATGWEVVMREDRIVPEQQTLVC